MISLIWAMDKNRLIGKDNKLPWRLPNDLAYFKKTTIGHIVVMGRKTFESVGKPLPARTNWVVTRDKSYRAEGCEMFYSIEEVLKAAVDEEVFVIGGAEIYSKFLSFADRLYITLINESFNGDTFFPEIKEENWKLVSKIEGVRDEKNPYDYNFMVYEKKYK
jgi:dihydrofolate reductase